MANRQTAHALGQIPMPTPSGSEVIVARVVYDSAVLGALALNDVVEMGFLPAGCVPVDWVLDVDDLDSGSPAIVLDFGILNAGKTAVSTAAADGGAKWLSGSTIAQAGGVARPTTVPTWRVTADNTANRAIGLVCTTASATFQAGKIGLTFKYRSA